MGDCQFPGVRRLFPVVSNDLQYSLYSSTALSLPDSLRDPAVGPDQFRRDLKTHLWHCVSFSALAVFSRNALYKSTFYLLTYLLTYSSRQLVRHKRSLRGEVLPPPQRRSTCWKCLYGGCGLRPYIVVYWIIFVVVFASPQINNVLAGFSLSQM